MARRVPTWLWVVTGIVVLGILGIVALAAAGLYFFSRNFETREVSASTAAQEFQQIREKFAGHKPLIELDERGRLLRTNPDRPARHNPERPRTLHVLAFDPDDEHIVEVRIPFWLLRFKTGGATIDLNRGPMDLEDLKLSVEELERLGPTLIVDHTTTSGERVLVWSQ